jgi:AcrR family transcriptional regulator
VSSKRAASPDPQLRKLLSRSDWGEILRLLETKSYQRKFQIIEAFTELVASRGFHRATHAEIARKCGVTRQLVDHHFPDETALVSLSYRYVYAGFQKAAADGLITKDQFINQLKGYIDAVATWIGEKGNHARFLVQFYALVGLSPELSELNERNIRIGHERLVSLCLAAREKGLFQGISEEGLSARVFSLQTYILGFLVMHSRKGAPEFPGAVHSPGAASSKDELWRCCLAILSLSSRLER